MRPKISDRHFDSSWVRRTSRPAISVAPSNSLLKFTESTFHIAVLTKGCESCKPVSVEVEITEGPKCPISFSLSLNRTTRQAKLYRTPTPLELTFILRSC